MSHLDEIGAAGAAPTPFPLTEPFGPRALTALSPPGTFSVTAGEDELRVWDPGDGWKKAFCGGCGSHTHTTSPDDPSVVATRMGCLDGDPGITPMAHQFVSYASPLEPLPDDGLPRFPERLGTTPPL